MGGGNLMNDAGKVAFTPKGDYSNAVTYEYLDTVVYNGNAYAALKTTTGKAPTDSDTDENWKLLAMGGTAVPIAKKETTGVVKASSDIGVSDDGSMILETDYTSQESLAELTSGESRTTFFGKIAKAVSTLISHITTSATSSVLGHVKLTDSTAVTDSTGLALPATEKNASVEGTLANQISVLNTNLKYKENNFSNPNICFATGKALKFGDVITLNYQGDIINVVDNSVLGNLESEFSPRYDMTFLAKTTTGISISVDVQTNGTIYLHPGDIINERVKFNLTATYVV